MAIIKNIEQFNTAKESCNNCVKALENASEHFEFRALWNEAAKSRRDIIETLEFALLIRSILNMSPGSIHSLQNYEVLNIISADGSNKDINLLPKNRADDLIEALKTNDKQEAAAIAKLITKLRYESDHEDSVHR